MNCKSQNELNSEHRTKMNWVLYSIRNKVNCDVCNKIIFKNIYSGRGNWNDEICCSHDCLDLFNPSIHRRFS